MLATLFRFLVLPIIVGGIIGIVLSIDKDKLDKESEITKRVYDEVIKTGFNYKGTAIEEALNTYKINLIKEGK